MGKDACRNADIDNSGTISKTELRNMLHQYCFILGDDKFESLFHRIAASVGAAGATEISYDDFMRHFARLGGNDFQKLDASMSISEAKTAIAEKIEGKISGG